MSVHYKFKSALDFDTITFDGLHISVADLKKAIIQQKRIGKIADFDLQIINAQTKEEYTDDTTLIPKNTSLTIARIPLAIQPKKQWEPSMEKGSAMKMHVEQERAHVDLSRINGSEEDKINAMIMQSTADYDPTNYQKIRGSNQTGEVPINYRCFKCHKPGHWIKNCPMIGSTDMTEMKRNTGIPRSFIEQQQNEIFQHSIVVPVVEKAQEVPDDLICGICKDLFTDAVMIPCCGSSFCDECVRTALLESEDNECPDCHEKGSSPGSLIPNRFLRNSVNSFKNETGYNRKPVSKPKVALMILPGEEKPLQPPEEKEESDYEDNITVTVPPAHLQCRGAFRDRQINGKSRGDENPMKTLNDDRSETPTVDENDVYAGLSEEPHCRRLLERPQQDEINRRSPKPRDNQHYGQYRELMPSNNYGRHENEYISSVQPHYSSHSRPLFEQPLYGGNHRISYQNRLVSGIYPPKLMRPGPPMCSLASVYQGVAAKVGPGIIDDPLEAFNRIMREKERRKERRRSRSPENDNRRLPLRRRVSRARSPELRRQRSNERRLGDHRRKRSSSYSRSSRSSRSRSRSPPKISRSPRKRSRTPRNRTRSRSPSFSISRSRSRSITPAGRYRERGPQHNRYHRSPHSRSPPRHRMREHRRDERNERSDRKDRDNFLRDSYHDKTPQHGGYSRGSRGYSRSARSRGGSSYGQRVERQPLLPHPPQQAQIDPYYQQSSTTVPIEYYPDNQYHRYPPRSHSIQPLAYIKNLTPIEPHRFDETPTGKKSMREIAKDIDQPPVPGLEKDEHIEKYPKELYTYSEASGGSGEDGRKTPLDIELRQLPDSSTNEERRNEEIHTEEKLQGRSRSRSKESKRNRERSKTKTPNKWDIRPATSKEKNREKHEWRDGIDSIKLQRRGGAGAKKRTENGSRMREREEKKHRESSEDDSKKRSKDKKKRKKDRDIEKKRSKKDKKREKEARKEISSLREKPQADVVVNDCKDNHSETPAAPSVVQPAPATLRNILEEEDKLMEKALIDEESTTPNHNKRQSEDKLDIPCDLYGDIMDKNDINLDFGQSEDILESSEAKQEKNSPNFIRNDSILDINPTIYFEHDTEDGEMIMANQEEKKTIPTTVLVTIPEPSKWELEEEQANPSDGFIKSGSQDASSPENRSGKVTNEVLKRAENALFSRAINAIRPIEIRSINAERRKLYEDDMVPPVSSVIVKTSPPKDMQRTFQITVPTNNDGVERSVEIKSGPEMIIEKLKLSPVRSIKDRLGLKVVDDIEPPPLTFTPSLESEIRRSSQKGKKETTQLTPEKISRHNSPRKADERDRNFRGLWNQRESKFKDSSDTRGGSRDRRERSSWNIKKASRSAEDSHDRRKNELLKMDRIRRKSPEKMLRDFKRSPNRYNRQGSPKHSRSPKRKSSPNKHRERGKRQNAEVKDKALNEQKVQKGTAPTEKYGGPKKCHDEKKLLYDESNFEPDYDIHNDLPENTQDEKKLGANNKKSVDMKLSNELRRSNIEVNDSFSPELQLEDKKAIPIKKDPISPSNSCSSDSDLTERGSTNEGYGKKRKKSNKHRKQKRKHASSTESIDKVTCGSGGKKAKKSKKSHKKKKKNRHK